MKLAVFYPHSIYSAWSVSEGLVDEFKRMGHEVRSCPIVPDPKAKLHRQKFPTLDELREFDRIIVSGPEHLKLFVLALYPEWVKVKVPKVGWWHETVNRADYGTLPIEKIKLLFDKLYTPAIQDEKYGMEWLPFGVDTCAFRRQVVCEEGDKRYDAVFIGLLYEKRAKFLAENNLELKVGNVCVTDLDGVNIRKSANLLAETTRQVKVMVNLPSLCHHLVTKVFETLACGTALVTPFMEGTGEENFKLFENGTHLQYYGKNPKGIIEVLLNEPDYREKMARQGYEEVLLKHDLRLRCEKLLSAF